MSHRQCNLESRWAAAVLAAGALLFFAGCDKPTEADCRRAVENIRQIYETDVNDVGATPEAMVRSCRGSASPRSVRCYIQAKTKEDLQKCTGDTKAKLFANDAEIGSEPDSDKAASQSNDGAE